MMRDGGQMIIEGDVLDETCASFARFHYRCPHHEDPSNWWVPTIACLREWVECSFFEIDQEFHAFDRTRRSVWKEIKRRTKLFLGRDTFAVGRHVLVARAVRRADPNYLFADSELADFDLNVYS